MPVAKSYLEKIDPQMWLTLIGFVFTLGIIYGEFQTMKNQIYIHHVNIFTVMIV